MTVIEVAHTEGERVYGIVPSEAMHRLCDMVSRFSKRKKSRVVIPVDLEAQRGENERTFTVEWDPKDRKWILTETTL